MMARDADEEEQATKPSPGFYENKFLFEQIEGQQFVSNSLRPSETSKPKTSPSITLDGTTYTPLQNCPWPLAKEAVIYDNIKSLWKETRSFIYEHLFLPEEALYDVATAWVTSTWIREVWSVVPYLFFYGPVASGKTRGLETLQRISYRGILASNISAAAIYRVNHEWHPTLFLDETEIYSKENKAEIIGLLNSGYRKGQYTVRCKPTDHGQELEVLDVFGFKALAGTKGLANALESRSIMIRMLKRRRATKRFIDEKWATELRGKLLMLRLNTLGAHAFGDLSDLCDYFTKGVPQLNVSDGRLEELFSCLLAVSNDGRESIAAYAHELEEIRHFEEKASDEAEIVEILSENEAIMNEKSIALTKDIAEIFNQNRPEREKYKTSSIGWIIRELGFNKVHTKTGKGWLINKDRLKYWQQIYQIDEASPEKGQKGHNSHQAELPSVQSALEFVRRRFIEGTQEEWTRLAVEAGLTEKEAEALFESLKGTELFWRDREDGSPVWRWVNA